MRDNTTVIDRADTWIDLLCKETYIKTHRPSLNRGLKASKELQIRYFK